MPLLGTTRLLILMIYSYLHYYLELKQSLKMNNQGENTQLSDAIKQIVLESKEFFSKKHKFSNSMYESAFFFPTCLLLFLIISCLHVYLALHVY